MKDRKYEVELHGCHSVKWIAALICRCQLGLTKFSIAVQDKKISCECHATIEYGTTMGYLNVYNEEALP